MSRIFISHSSHNNRDALALKVWLESQGWKDEVFLDLDPVSGIKTGIRWKEALAQASSRCEAMICLTSPEWVNSPECVAEYRTAENINATAKNIRKPISILVAQIAELDSPDRTREWQGCQLFGEGPKTEVVLNAQDVPVRFLADGLSRLKQGLLEAGISRALPKHFPWPPEDEAKRAPYRGLEPLEWQDAGIFFGRDAEILRGLTELDRMRVAGDVPIFVILGASGTGKSSFLRAGLVPRLSRDDRHFFPLEVIRPKRNPLFGERGLAHVIAMANDRLGLRPINPGDVKTALTTGSNRFRELLHNMQQAAKIRLAGSLETEPPPTLVLSVDQAEELFNADATEEAKAFLRMIEAVLRNGSSDTEVPRLPIIVIFTIRSDRYEPLQTASELVGLQRVVFDDLRPMPPAQFKEVITGPASRTLVNGRPLEVKADLVSRLLDDCAKGADTLPLLALTLARLYRDYGNDGDLRLEEYTAMDGMAQVIKTEAESILATDRELRMSQLERLHAAFVPWLATINTDNDQPMRRVARMSDLPNESHPLVQALIEKRLLLSDQREGESVVEVAHESLLRQWDVVANWLVVEREDLKEADRLQQDAKAWAANGKKEAWLREGERLSIGEVLAAKSAYRRRLDPIREFLLASRDREEERRNEEVRVLKRDKRRQRAIIFASMAAAAVFLIVAAVAGLQWIKAKEQIAMNYWAQAVNERKNGDSLRAAHFFANSTKDFGPVLTYVSYTSKFGLNDQKAAEVQSQIRASLLNVQADSQGIFLDYVLEHGKDITGVVFSNDEQRILTWGQDGMARLWQTKDGVPVGQPMKHDGSVGGATFSKDEQWILTWSDGGTARLWQAKDGVPVGQPMKHGWSIRGATFSKDEQRILTWGQDGMARLWQTKDGVPVGQPMKHDKGVPGATFSKDEQWILTWSDDGTARLWQAKDGVPVGQPMKHDGSVWGATFSKDEQRILTWGQDGTARLWQAKDGVPAGKPLRHDKGVRGATFSKDEQRILTWSDDGTARLWRAKDGVPVGQSMKHDGSVWGATFSKDEQRILTWSLDGTARLWQAKDGVPAGKPLRHDKGVWGATFSKDEQWILTRSEDGTARLWQAKDGVPVGQPMKHDGLVQGAMFSKNEQRILTWSANGTVRLWRAKDGVPVGQPLRHDKGVRGATFSKDEQRILTWGQDGTARLWQAKDDAPVGQLLRHGGSIRGATFSRDEQRILTWSLDGTARLWRAKDGIPVGQPLRHDKGVRGATFSKDEQRILTWSADGTARLWQTKDGIPVGQPLSHDGSVRGATFSKDEQRILTWSDDGTARLWQAKDGVPVGQPLRHDKGVWGATFSKDEQWILTRSEDGTARLWQTKDGVPVGQPLSHGGSVEGATFSKDEQRILTWSQDGTARLWQAKDGVPVGQSMKHDGSVWGATFSKDEQRILTWSLDGTARLWRAKDGVPVGQPLSHGGSVWGATFSKDEQRILTWSEDGTARLWQAKDGIPVGQPLRQGGSVQGATFSKDEQRILTWGGNGTARLWQAKDGVPVGQLLRHGGSVQGATFSKDEQRILTWNDNGTARLWDVHADYDLPGDLLTLLVQVVTGTAMDNFGNIRALNSHDWIEKRVKYLQLAEKHLQRCEYQTVNLYNTQKQYWDSVIAQPTIQIFK